MAFKIVTVRRCFFYVEGVRSEERTLPEGKFGARRWLITAVLSSCCLLLLVCEKTEDVRCGLLLLITVLRLLLNELCEAIHAVILTKW